MNKKLTNIVLAFAMLACTSLLASDLFKKYASNAHAIIEDIGLENAIAAVKLEEDSGENEIERLIVASEWSSEKTFLQYFNDAKAALEAYEGFPEEYTKRDVRYVIAQNAMSDNCFVKEAYQVVKDAITENGPQANNFKFLIGYFYTKRQVLGISVAEQFKNLETSLIVNPFNTVLLDLVFDMLTDNANIDPLPLLNMLDKKYTLKLLETEDATLKQTIKKIRVFKDLYK